MIIRMIKRIKEELGLSEQTLVNLRSDGKVIIFGVILGRWTQTEHGALIELCNHEPILLAA